MKSTIKRILVLSIWVLMAQQVALGSEEAAKSVPVEEATKSVSVEEATESVPVAEVVNANYPFETAVEGSEVVHDFIIKNTGTAPLHIEKVKTG